MGLCPSPIFPFKRTLGGWLWARPHDLILTGSSARPYSKSGPHRYPRGTSMLPTSQPNNCHVAQKPPGHCCGSWSGIQALGRQASRWAWHRACSTNYKPDLMRTPQIWTELGRTACSHVDTFAFSHEYTLLSFFQNQQKSECFSQSMSLPLREAACSREEQLGSHSGGSSEPPSWWDALYCRVPSCGPMDI